MAKKISIAVFPESLENSMHAQHLASKLKIPIANNITNDVDFLLLATSRGLMLKKTDTPSPGPLFIDFLNSKTKKRIKNLSKELLLKALGIKKNLLCSVVDATAGLGQDGFLLANTGCKVTMLERSTILATLLEDALMRAKQDPQFQNLQLEIIKTDAIDYLKKLPQSFSPDIIYLDPMFPERTKTAAVKKAAYYLQNLIGEDLDAEELLNVALTKAQKRVVVKRPRLAKKISDKLEPHHQIIGKTTRFDIYMP